MLVSITVLRFFQNKRLLVVGGGNTACDIVADAVPVASRVYLSMRRPVHFLPKYSFGNPGDVTLRLMNRLKVPMFVQRFLSSLGARVVNGHPKTIGLRMPAERIFDANVTVSSIVPFHIRQGDVVVKPEIKRSRRKSGPFYRWNNAKTLTSSFLRRAIN